jgi:hypothetical protein
MAIITRLVNPLGGSLRLAKYVVLPQPVRAAAAARARVAQIQRLLFFKIPYLDQQRGAGREKWRYQGPLRDRFPEQLLHVDQPGQKREATRASPGSRPSLQH